LAERAFNDVVQLWLAMKNAALMSERGISIRE
jgi:hypothetical protein